MCHVVLLRWIIRVFICSGFFAQTSFFPNVLEKRCNEGLYLPEQAIAGNQAGTGGIRFSSSKRQLYLSWRPARIDLQVFRTDTSIFMKEKIMRKRHIHARHNEYIVVHRKNNYRSRSNSDSDSGSIFKLVCIGIWLLLFIAHWKAIWI